MKVNVRSLLINVSLLFIMCVALIRPYIFKIFNVEGINVIFIIIALLLVTFLVLCKLKIKLYCKEYLLFSLLLVGVSLYNNAYMQDGKYGEIAIYILSIVYFALLTLLQPSEENLKFSLIIVVVFALLTTLATWICYLFPEFYRYNIITLLPIDSQEYVLRTYSLVNPGLTAHYSRNAFYIVCGMISLFKFYIDSKQKKYLVLEGFLLVTLYIVGKRGHLIFLLLSLIISFILFERLKVKTTFRLIGIVISIVIFTILIIRFIPQARFAFERIFENDSEDFSTGRIEMYQEAWSLFKNNNYSPIGWGQYSKSTGYYHPALHNDYIQLFIEVGIIGIVVVVGINMMFLKRSIEYSRIKKDAFGFVAILYNVFFMTYSLTGLPHYDIEAYIIYFMINSFLYIQLEREKE